MNCEAVATCMQAGAVMSAETSDFLFNRRDLKVLSEDNYEVSSQAVREMCNFST
jgi:hypothetical protein